MLGGSLLPRWLPPLALAASGWQVPESEFCANATYDRRLDDPATFNYCR